MTKIVTLLLFGSVAFAKQEIKPNNFTVYKAQIVCETVCYQDGDELGVLINGLCYCANKRDTSHIVTRVMSKSIDNKEDKREQTVRW